MFALLILSSYIYCSYAHVCESYLFIALYRFSHIMIILICLNIQVVNVILYTPYTTVILTIAHHRISLSTLVFTNTCIPIIYILLTVTGLPW